MAIAQSRLTAQGQISVPAEVRRKLGLAPGSVIEWQEVDGAFMVRKGGGVTFDDIHKMLFPDGPPSPPATVEQMNEAIREHARRKHARR